MRDIGVCRGAAMGLQRKAVGCQGVEVRCLWLLVDHEKPGDMLLSKIRTQRGIQTMA